MRQNLQNNYSLHLKKIVKLKFQRKEFKQVVKFLRRKEFKNNKKVKI